jgi:hypothetical protein
MGAVPDGVTAKAAEWGRLLAASERRARAAGASARDQAIAARQTIR